MRKMSKQKKPGNYAFIDSQNLNMTITKLGWKMDWRKFRKFLAEKHEVSKAYMFIGYVPEQIDMYEKLHDAGYAVVLKPTFDLTRPQQEDKNSKNGDKPIKGNIDADLVLWAMKELDKYDKAVLVTGDGDFYSLAEYLAEQGKLRKILAPSGHYSRLFNKFEQYIERIDSQRKNLEYFDYKNTKPKRNPQKIN